MKDLLSTNYVSGTRNKGMNTIVKRKNNSCLLELLFWQDDRDIKEKEVRFQRSSFNVGGTPTSHVALPGFKPWICSHSAPCACAPWDVADGDKHPWVPATLTESHIEFGLLASFWRCSGYCMHPRSDPVDKRFLLLFFQITYIKERKEENFTKICEGHFLGDSK